MTQAELVLLGASTLKQGSPRWQCYVPIGNDNDDIQSWTECPVYQGLGLTSLPEGKDASGAAEAILLPQVGNRKGVIVGGRDTRDADIVGKMDPGDTVLHATGKGKKPQIQLKKKKRSASVVVPCKDGQDMLLALDGQNQTAQILARGAAISIQEDGSILLAAKGGASIVLDSEINFLGPARFPGIPSGMFMMAGPITGQLAGAAGAAPTTQLVPVPGIGGTG